MIDNTIPEEQWATWGKLVLNLTNRRGYAISEKTTCPHCGNVNFHVHFHAETLQCMNDECKKRYPSNIARPPQPGETTDDHWRNAMDVVFKAARATQKSLPPITEAEYNAMSPALKSLVARAQTAANIGMLAKVLAVAEGLAEQEV